MGITASGIHYPEPSEPVTQGAANMEQLAADVTAVYLGKAALSSAIQPLGAAAGTNPVRYAAGLATITFTGGNGSLVLPNGGKAWSQLFYLGIRYVGGTTSNIPNYSFTTAATGTPGQFYVSGYLNNVLIGSGPVNVQFFAIGQ